MLSRLERRMADAIASFSNGNVPEFPTINVALDWKHQHQAQAHEGRDVEPWDCNECMWLEAICYAAAKKANALPFKLEAPY